MTPDKEVLTYCRIGERSSHPRLVLKNLPGCPGARTYDSSPTESRILVRVPIEKP